ncbi:MAG: xanthine dehydrogenase small subunit, partial [Pseudomonadota bacterium]
LVLEADRVTEARIAFGGMAATPRRAAKAEAALVGRRFDRAALDAACSALEEDFHPFTDWRATAAYRMAAAQGLLRRVWYERAGQAVYPGRSVAEALP